MLVEITFGYIVIDEGNMIKVGNFTVELLKEENFGDYLTKELKLKEHEVSTCKQERSYTHTF